MSDVTYMLFTSSVYKRYKSSYKVYKLGTAAKYMSSTNSLCRPLALPTFNKTPQNANTHPERFSLGQVNLPLGLRVVVDKKTGIQHEVAILERSMQGALLHQRAFLARIREIESERSSLCHYLSTIYYNFFCGSPTYMKRRPLISC